MNTDLILLEPTMVTLTFNITIRGPSIKCQEALQYIIKRGPAIALILNANKTAIMLGGHSEEVSAHLRSEYDAILRIDCPQSPKF
jgi:hypothetical protein